MKRQRKLVSIFCAASLLAVGAMTSSAQTRQPISHFVPVGTVGLHDAAQVKNVAPDQTIRVKAITPDDTLHATAPGAANAAKFNAPDFIRNAAQVKTLGPKDVLGAR